MAAVGCVWGVLLGTYAVNKLTEPGTPLLAGKLSYAAAAAIVGAGFSTMLGGLVRRVPHRAGLGPRVVRFAAAALAVTVAHAVVDVPLQAAIEPSLPADPVTLFAQNLAFYVFAHTAVAAMLLLHVVTEQVRHQERRQQSREIEQVRAEISNLRFQLRPHFLFNSMNGIHGLMLSERVPEADRALTQLAAFMRHTLSCDFASWRSLREELSVARVYTGIEEVRFGHRLHVAYQVDDAALATRLPALTLVSLVQGIVAHAAASPRPATVKILLRARREWVWVGVRSNVRSTDASCSVLEETRQRLQSAEPRLQVRARLGGTGWRVTLVVPRRAGGKVPMGLQEAARALS